MEHRDPEFLRINPNGQVPSLIYNGHVMSGSDTILEFLEEAHPSVNPSLPSDLYQRQTVRQIYSLIGGFIQPLQNPFLAAKFANKYEAGNEEKIAFIKKDWMYSVIRDGFVALEKLLEQHSGKYCFGDSITMADFFLVPQVANAVRNGVELKEFPIINALNERLLQEECFKVFFPGDHRFRRFQYPPTVQYLVQGELVEGSSKGLQKNEDDTWGVCLPYKGQGNIYAKIYFSQLKIENAHLLN